MDQIELLTNEQKNQELMSASQNGHIAIVTHLLQDPRVDPSYNTNWAIRLAFQNCHLEIVTLLLQDPRVDTSVDNYAIRWASRYGHLEIVNLLLQDPRVDPSADNNMAIRWASYYGHIAVVTLLLQDTRVDPSADNNWAIRHASENGHLAVVKKLILDPRVNVHTLDPGNVKLLSIELIISMNLALPFPADSKIKQFESAVREQRQEFIDIIDECTVYNNTDTHGIHRDLWKYVVSIYLE
jgi:ankyrin repeat protein